MPSKSEDNKPGPRSSRLSIVAADLAKEAALDASPGSLTPRRRSARLSGSFPSPALESLTLPTRRRRSSSSTSMTEEAKVVKPRLCLRNKTSELPEKIDEEVVIIDDDELAKEEEATPPKRTRLGRRQSELMDTENTVESPSKTRATRSRKIVDIQEVVIIDDEEDPVPAEAASLQTRTRRGRRQSELLQNENVVNSPSKTRATRSKKILDIKEEAAVAAGTSSPVKVNSPGKSATSQSEAIASPPVKIALTKQKKPEDIAPATTPQSEIEGSPVKIEEKKNVEDALLEESQSEVIIVQSDQKIVENVVLLAAGHFEVTKSPVKIDLSMTEIVAEEKAITSLVKVEEGEEEMPYLAKAVSQDVVEANATKEVEKRVLVKTEDVMEVDEDLSDENLPESSAEKEEEISERDVLGCEENAAKSSVGEDQEAFEAVAKEDDNPVKSTEIVDLDDDSSPKKRSDGDEDAVVRDVSDALLVVSSKREVVAEHEEETDQFLVVEGVGEETPIVTEVGEETKDDTSEEIVAIKDPATASDVSSKAESSTVNNECSPTKYRSATDPSTPVKQTLPKKFSIEDNKSSDAVVARDVEDKEAAVGEVADVTIDEKEMKITPKSSNEKVVSPVKPCVAEILKSVLHKVSSSAEDDNKEDEVDSDVFAEDKEIVDNVLKKASIGEEDYEAEVDQNEELEEAEENYNPKVFAKEIVEAAPDQVATAVDTSEIVQTEKSDVSALTEIDQSSVKVVSRQEPSNEEKCLHNEDTEMVEIIEKTLLENEIKKIEESFESPKKPSEDLEASAAVDLKEPSEDLEVATAVNPKGPSKDLEAAAAEDPKEPSEDLEVAAAEEIESDVVMASQEIETETEARHDVEMETMKDEQKPSSLTAKSVNQESDGGSNSDEKENANSGHKNCEPGPSRPDTSKPGPSKGGAAKKSQDLSLGRRESGRFWKSDRDRFRSVIKSRGLKTSFKQRKEQKETLKRVKEMEQNLKDETKRQRDELKARQEANKKKREENEKRTEIVQEIKNPSKLKRMKKKQVKLLEKRDTTVVQKNA